ncbi:MAG: hypothetical protein JWP59_789, partial [Massilia sp.]|nr:hypothetical protein [Massilia sp.]
MLGWGLYFIDADRCMNYLILTRAGLDDFAAHAGATVRTGVTVHLNPGVAGADDIAALRAAGATVELLEMALTYAEAAEAAFAIPRPAGATLWIEAPPAPRA